MSELLQYVIKKSSYFARILAISLIAVFLFYFTGFTSYADRLLYDIFINSRVWFGPAERNPLIAAIDLDDASIEALGGRIDTRQAFADIIEVLADSGVDAMAVDFLFPNEKPNDSFFVNAVGYAQNTIIASLAIDKERMSTVSYRELTISEKLTLQRHVWQIKVLKKGNIPEAGTFLLPFSALMEASAQIAHINMSPDSDGIYRRIPLLYKWEGGYIPSLGLASAVWYLGIPVESIELKAGNYLALPLSEKETIRIPIDKNGCMLIPYTNKWADDAQRIPFTKLVDAKTDKAIFEEIFNGLSRHIALIAEISQSQKDYGPTSFERLFPLSVVHAEILGGILNWPERFSFIYWASLWYKVLVLVLLVFTACLCVHAKRDMVFHLGFLFILFLFMGLTILLWYGVYQSPWFAFPSTVLFFIWLNAFIDRLLIKYREQLLLRSALSRYISQNLVDRIMLEKKTRLAPAYKELTILFSDISGFTNWSSHITAIEVHDFLNDYFETMAGVLFSFGGSVNKFMGDGILAFFGDPFEMPNHCEQCVKAAITMQEKTKDLAEKWKPLVEIDLKVRIGINTGKVIVGNLGNKNRIEYTVVGAAVNLAQRMESSAPDGGILVTAIVHEILKDKFTFTEKKEIPVKGFAETIEAYLVGSPVIELDNKV